jgi:hypothetical protein
LHPGSFFKIVLSIGASVLVFVNPLKSDGP